MWQTVVLPQRDRKIPISALMQFTAEPQTSVASVNEPLPRYSQKTLTIWESIAGWLTSCWTGLDLTKEVKLMLIQHKQSS